MAKPILGRGLSALLGGAAASSPSAKASPAPAPAIPSAPTGEAVELIALDRFAPLPLQPRKDFSPESLQELADSIKEQGIVQPLIVRQRGGRF